MTEMEKMAQAVTSDGTAVQSDNILEVRNLVKWFPIKSSFFKA